MSRPAFALSALVLVTAVAWAPAAAQAGSGDGFLFGRPAATLTLRGGYDRPLARGAIFDFVTDQVTLGRGAFGGAAVNAELAVSVGPRLELALGGGYVNAARGSEFRRFINQDDTPITQTTSLRRVPVTAGLKLYLAPRGREIGRLAWIPARVAPWVGAGGGAVGYQFRQTGSFVDPATLEIFDVNGDDFTSSGWAPAGYAAAGADWSLSTRFVASAEVRYTAARGALTRGLRDFNRINLSGAALNAGVGVRF
jgi:hypothetical protein